MKPSTATAVSALALANQTYAWGAMGHQTVGFVAQHYLAPATITWTQTLLANTNSSYLASVATWADSYRYTDAGKFSAPFHYIDANDSPPSSCGVELARDCHEEGCIVSAITNYTGRVRDLTLGMDERKMALQFLTHFFGDVTQPLHDEATAVGGNQINVTFDGKKTNLHHIWDSEIPEKVVGGNKTEDARKWAEKLSKEIDDGMYKDQKAGWVSGLTLTDVTGSALGMARDANGIVCTYTLKPGVDALESQDLGGDYYANAAPIVTTQIAKGGYRLAAWLNLIVTGQTGF